jgi:hypothetical protein
MITAFAISEDCERLASGDKSGEVICWDIKRKRSFGKWQYETGRKHQTRLNYWESLDLVKCTARRILRSFALSRPLTRRNAWLLLLPWAVSRSTFDV